MENLVEVRCPEWKAGKPNGQLYKCNRICVKVTPGSAGEARCRSCHVSFEFEVDSQAQMTTGVKVTKIGSTENNEKTE